MHLLHLLSAQYFCFFGASKPTALVALGLSRDGIQELSISIDMAKKLLIILQQITYSNMVQNEFDSSQGGRKGHDIRFHLNVESLRLKIDLPEYLCQYVLH